MRIFFYIRAAVFCVSLFCIGSLVNAGVPWGHSDDFETTEGYASGDLHGQSGWAVESGDASVISGEAPSGSQMVSVAGRDPLTRAVKSAVAPSGETVLFLDYFARFSARALPSTSSLVKEDLVHLTLSEDGRFYIFDGDGTGGGSWRWIADFSLGSGGVMESWTRITLRIDLAVKRMDIFVDSQLAVTGIGFLDNSVEDFWHLILEGGADGAAYFDNLYVGTENPLFADILREGLPDSWKSAHGLGLDFPVRDADPDGDGLTNLEEYFYGTDPLAPDTSRDGLTDGESVSLGLNPRMAENALPAELPIHDDFEYWPTGDIHARGGWIVSQGAATVQGSQAHGGTQALYVGSEYEDSAVRIEAESNSADIVWTDLQLRPMLRTTAGHPSLQVGTTVGFYFSGDGNLVVFDGTVSEWKTIRPVRAIDFSEWVRVTILKDYTAGTWSIWCNGLRIGSDLGFASQGDRFRSFSLTEPARSGGAYLDDLHIDFPEPDDLGNFADGLTNAERIALGLDPEVPDTSNDGMWDGEKIQWGLDPLVADDFVRLSPDGNGRPFWSTSFETSEGFFPGSAIGQEGWMGSGDVVVTASEASDGEQSLEIRTLDNTVDPPGSVHRFAGLEDATEVWVTMDTRLQRGNLPNVSTIENRSSALVAVNASGFLYGYDGKQKRWVNSGYFLEEENGWRRLDFFIDYRNGLWSLCVDKVMVLRDLEVRDRSLLTLTRIKLTGARKNASSAPASGFDHVRISLDEPPGLDFSGDGMTNDEKRALGLDIYKTDTTGDGLPDWWLVRHGFDPFDTTVGERDEDGDGLTNRQEFILGSDPRSADGDEDGWNDFQEYLAGTDPNDPLDSPLAADVAPWTSNEINVRRSGGAYLVNEEVRIIADARDVTGVTDGLQYLAQEITGDFEISARVVSLENIDPWSSPIARGARAGLMVRESMAPGSPFAVMSLTPVRYYFRGRSAPDTFTDFNFSRNPPIPFREGVDQPTHFPSWIKLKRRGNVFSGYRSYDGENWVIVGSWSLNLPETVPVGLMAASGLYHQYSRAVFDDVQVRLGAEVPGYWERPDFALDLDPVAHISGFAYTDSMGDWQRTGDSVYARSIRGSLDYSVTLESDGPYVLEIAGGEFNPHGTNERFPLVVTVNRQEAGRPVLVAPSGTSGSVRLFLPYLKAGEHLISIEWRNDVPNSFLRIDGLQVFRVDDDEDADENGIPDWFDARLADLAWLDEAPAVSLVSPYSLEGKSHYLNLLEVSGYTAPEDPVEPVPAQQGLFGHYYADVPLDPAGPTEILVAEQGIAEFSKTVTWEAVNLLETLEEEFLIRQGDSMRFTATNISSHANPNHPITLHLAPLDDPEQVDEFIGIASKPVVVTFEEEGDFIVAGRVGESTSPEDNGFVAVRVVSTDLGSPPSAIIGHVRNWQVPYLPEEAEVEWDSHLFVAEVSRDEDSRSYRIAAREDRHGRILARLGEDGPVLDGVSVRAVRDDSHAYTTWKIIESFSDGSFIVEGVISLGDVPDDLELHLNIFRAGVLFDDGTTDRIVTAAHFDAYGVYRYRLLQNAETIGAACHEVAIYQGGDLIGER